MKINPTVTQKRCAAKKCVQEEQAQAYYFYFKECCFHEASVSGQSCV